MPDTNRAAGTSFRRVRMPCRTHRSRDEVDSLNGQPGPETHLLLRDPGARIVELVLQLIEDDIGIDVFASTARLVTRAQPARDEFGLNVTTHVTVPPCTYFGR